MAVGKKGSGTKRRREVDVVEEVVLSGEESSEGGGAGREEDVEGFQGGVSVDEEDEGDDARETAAEKRLRLAKKYLSDLGVEDDESGGDEEEELEATAKRNAGLLSANLADGLVDAKVSVSTSRKGHRLSPTCISMTPDNLLAVSGGKDRRVVIWDVEKCKVIHSFRGGDPHKKAYTQVGHVKEVLSVAVSDDGRLAASGGLDKLIRVWDTRSKQAVQALSGHRSGVNSLVFRRSSKQLFTASSDRTLNLYDLGEMAYVESLFGHGAEVISVDALSKERALSGGMDGTVRLWKLTEGSQLVFKSPAQSIDAVAMLNDSSFLTGGSNGALYLWGVHKKKVTTDLSYTSQAVSRCGTHKHTDKLRKLLT